MKMRVIITAGVLIALTTTLIALYIVLQTPDPSFSGEIKLSPTQSPSLSPTPSPVGDSTIINEELPTSTPSQRIASTPTPSPVRETSPSPASRRRTDDRYEWYEDD